MRQHSRQEPNEALARDADKYSLSAIMATRAPLFIASYISRLFYDHLRPALWAHQEKWNPADTSCFYFGRFTAPGIRSKEDGYHFSSLACFFLLFSLGGLDVWKQRLICVTFLYIKYVFNMAWLLWRLSLILRPWPSCFFPFGPLGRDHVKISN